jgi:hypothetical protein
MSDAKKKPGVAFWATVVAFVGIVAAYPLLPGPLAWLDEHNMLPDWTETPISVMYAPMDWIIQRSETAYKAFDWYMELWTGPNGEEIEVPSRLPVP